MLAAERRVRGVLRFACDASARGRARPLIFMAVMANEPSESLRAADCFHRYPALRPELRVRDPRGTIDTAVGVHARQLPVPSHDHSRTDRLRGTARALRKRGRRRDEHPGVLRDHFAASALARELSVVPGRDHRRNRSPSAGAGSDRAPGRKPPRLRVRRIAAGPGSCTRSTRSAASSV